MTNPALVWWHVAYQDLCYVPILVAAYWFGAAGGVATAIVAGLGTALHFHAVWRDNAAFVVSQYGQAVAFVITGAVGGALATAERRANRQRQEAFDAARRAHADLQSSHEQLLRADRLSSLGEIATGLAHEIGNPLAGVKGALDIMKSRAAPGSPEAEFGALAAREIVRLEGLVEAFLSYARPTEPRRGDTNILDLLDRVIPLIGREADERDVSIHVRRTPSPSIFVDQEQIVQVLVNIVLNAVQVSPPGGRVEIATILENGHLVVDVCDEGPGIPPERLAKIFDPFFSTKKRGTGLGLSISQGIVRSHGGTIEVHQPGRGTVMRVRLPLAQSRRADVSSHATMTTS